MARPDGSIQSEMSAASGRIANTFGAIADEAAIAEGAAAGNTAGLQSDYRPDGALTLRGKAFNSAATKTYLNNLDANLRNDMQATFEGSKNNPAELKQNFDALQQDYRAKHVFPEIEGDFVASFARLRMPYQNKALSNFEEAQRDQERASTVDNLSATQTTIARISALDPTNPQTAQTVAIELDRADRLIDARISSQAITAEAGAKLKIRSRDDGLTNAALAQASTLKTPEEIAAYRANVKAKFAKGEFNGLSGDGYQSLDAGLHALQNARRTEIGSGVSQLTKNIDDYVERVASGLPTPPDEWTRYATSDAAKTPAGAVALRVGETKAKIATVMSKISIDDASRLVSGMRSEAAKGGATAPDAAIIDFAEKQLSKQRTAINTDQLGFAEQKRLIQQVAPIDFQGFATSNDPAAAGAVAAQFRDRTAQARAVGAELSRAPQFLRPEEKDRLKDIVSRGGPKALELAAAIVKGADYDAPAILREISGDAPLLAQAGNIIANGGSLAAARDAFNAAKVKAETGKELPGISSTISSKAMRDSFGSAFMMQGEDAGRIRSMADAIARTRLASGSVDPTGSEAETIYKRALQEAAGASFVGGVQYGGVAGYKPGYWTSYKVAVPPSIKADAFRDVIRAIRDDDLRTLPTPPLTADGRPYPARDIAAAIPIAVRGGYRFAMGEPTSDDPKYIRGADGAPFVLPFDALQRIAPRVSGALLGGR
ncbi:hypothetical protein P3G22_03030 [Rhodopseudomonas sp. BAL398]|nr:hypothetical protein [Rhodopseudomonas sp. BAL398]